MSKLIFSYFFKTNLANFRTAIIDDDTDRICRILDIEREYLNKCIDSDGNTALLLAIEFASPYTVRLLLEQGAQADQCNFHTGLTPLGSLASKEFEDWNSSRAKKVLEMMKILLEHGAFIDKPSTRTYHDEFKREYTTRETPLMTAVRKGNLSMVKFLIEKKSNVNFTERYTKIRPINYAVERGDETMFDLLENSGASINTVVTIGDENLLHWFCSNHDNDHRMSLLEKLIEKGCDVNGTNWEQRTPLFIAVKNEMPQTCQRLIDAQAHLDLIDSKGYRPIDLAQPTGQCMKLFPSTIVQQRRVSGTNSQNASPMKIGSARIRRYRLDLRRRPTLEIDGDKIQSPLSSKCSDRLDINDEQATRTSPTPYIYPDHRRDSDEMDTKYERMWEKLRQKRINRREQKNAAKERPDPL